MKTHLRNNVWSEGYEEHSTLFYKPFSFLGLSRYDLYHSIINIAVKGLWYYPRDVECSVSEHPYVSALTKAGGRCIDWTISLLNHNEVWSVQSVGDRTCIPFVTMQAVLGPPVLMFVGHLQ
jgi:hypothetical protein